MSRYIKKLYIRVSHDMGGEMGYVKMQERIKDTCSTLTSSDFALNSNF